MTQTAAAKILIVDDNDKNLDALETILRHPDYVLVRATSGEEALRHLMASNDFALVMLDVRMPGGMDGFECAQLIRSSRRFNDTPIIFLTGVATDMEFIYKGYGAGGVDYLVKPLEPSVVKAKVAIFVELFQSRQALSRQIEDLRAMSARLQEEISAKTTELEGLQDRFKGGGISLAH